MASKIHLVCGEPQVRAVLRAWLDRARLDPPIPLWIDVRLEEPPAHTDDPRPVFRQPGVVVRAGPSGGGVHLTWETAPAVAEVHATEPTACVTLSPSAAARLDECTETFLVTVLIFLLRRAGWHHIHAATALDPAGRGWLLAGDGLAGKSTTAALLATQGWRVGTDDTAFLASLNGCVTAVAYRAPIALRPPGYRLLGRLGGTLLARRRKLGYWPEELGGGFADRVVPDVILFTSVGIGPTTATPLGARECLAQLVRWSAWVMLEPDLAQQHLELLAALARQAKSYRVTLGRDLFARPNRLTELIA
ncbi:MAG: hypothetical protein AUH81_10425 [Candidatus Rokubacteria bacterium 13_1_40CM_4_69_5]|nr:MAG: hypothetical protein AUH81_10425 [Candidatus Rokubacteria bacterium 13_1_40CM_4_69_5]